MAGIPTDTRPASPLITGEALSVVWPEVSHRLAKLLTSRGAAPDVVDDVVQEVATRVLAHGIVFDDAMDLMRWAVPVALNLLVDNARLTQRVAPAGEDFDEPVADVADLVAHRDRLRRVMRALPQLSAADRAALTYCDAAPADRKEAVRLAVRRHRARRRLLALVDGVAAFVALLGGLARRSTRATTATVALAATPVAFLLAPPAPVVAPTVPEVAVEVVRPVRSVQVVRPPAPRPAAVPARPVAVRPAPAPVPAAPAPAAAKPVVEVGSPDAGVGVERKKKDRDDPIVCVRRLGITDDVCVNNVRVGHEDPL